MMRVMIAAAFLIGCGSLAADDAPKPRVVNRVVPAGGVVAIRTSARAETSPEILRAELEVRKAQVKAAEVAVRGARLKLARAEKLGTPESEEQAKLAVETAAAQLDIRKAEVRETEVRLAQAPKPSTGAKSLKNEVAVFNMPAVMKDFEKVKYNVYALNKLKLETSTKLQQLRAKLVKVDAQSHAENLDPARKDDLNEQKLKLERQYQDENHRISKELHAAAGKMIADLYDEIKMAVDDLATENGYKIVLAYPDVASTADLQNPSFKEFKLKPQAAQPFFVDSSADITRRLIERLNADYPPLDEKGNKVDVNKLPSVSPPAVVQPTLSLPSIKLGS